MAQNNYFYQIKPIALCFLLLCPTLSLPAQNKVHSPEITLDCSAIHVDARNESLHKIPQIIAHRGYWNTPGAAQNSIASIKKAQELGVYGAEIDVWITKDGVVVLNHDATIEKDTVQTSTYKQLKNKRLSNGEKLPTLTACLKQAKKAKDTKLIIEIKDHKSLKQHQAIVKACVDAVKKAGLEDKTEYISFSLEVCKELLQYYPQAIAAYLTGDIEPKRLHESGIKGIDYHISVLRKNPLWIKEAHQLGMTVNVWTVNKTHEIIEMMNAGADFITTDNPTEANLLQKCYLN